MEQLHLAPQRVKSTKPPSHRGSRVVSGDAYHRERGCGNERKGGARAMQKLKILGICEHQDRRASRSLLLCGTDGRAHSRVSTSQRISSSVSRGDSRLVLCLLHKEIGGRPIREHSPRSQSRRAVEHRSIGLNTSALLVGRTRV